ncbi:hypothetical protein ACTFIR_004283 [Dictyostelium discoideum]
MSSSANSSLATTKFKFTDNLWDGFDLLVKRTDSDLIQSKNILNFFKKKAELEEQHSKKLEKLSLKTMMTIDESTSINAISYNSSWKKIINSSMMESEQHTLLNTSILNKVIQPLQAMIKDMETKRKKILQEGIKLKQDMKEMVDELKKSQFKYDKAGKDLESSRMELREYRDQLDHQQQQQPSDSDLNNISKIERRIQRCEQDFSNCDEEYREQIKATNDFQHLYNTEKLPKILNDFEHFVVSHSHFSKSYFTNLVSVLIELPSAYQQNYEFVKKSVEMIDITNDVQEFIRKNLMKKQLAQPFQYEPYIEGKLTKKTISLTWNNKILSQFSRSSNNTTVNNTSSGNLNPYLNGGIGGAKKDEPILPTASFKVSLDELMNRQKDNHPTLEVPYVLQVLSTRIAQMKGHVTEGIFRVPGIISTIKETRLRIDKADFNLSNIDDVRTPAALLKQWLRDIPTALIPDSLYQQCIDTPTNAIAIVKTIPIINQRVLCYLINFLQIFTKFEFVAHSKMGTSNLAMVFAPCILRCTSTDANVMLNNVPNERLFVETLIKQIPPPLNTNEFLNLPISMSDAINDSEDIEELNDLDQLSNYDDNNNNNNNNNNNSNSNISIGSGSNSNIVVNYSNNSPNIESSTLPSQSVVTTIETLPPLNDDHSSGSGNESSNSSSSNSTTTPTGSPTTASKPRGPRTQTLGWVRIKPAPKPSAEPTITLSSSIAAGTTTTTTATGITTTTTTAGPEKTIIPPVIIKPAATPTTTTTSPTTTSPTTTTPAVTTSTIKTSSPDRTTPPTSSPPLASTKSTDELMKKLDQFTQETTPSIRVATTTTPTTTATTTTATTDKTTPETSSPPTASNISSEDLMKKLDQFINF